MIMYKFLSSSQSNESIFDQQQGPDLGGIMAACIDLLCADTGMSLGSPEEGDYFGLTEGFRYGCENLGLYPPAGFRHRTRFRVSIHGTTAAHVEYIVASS